MTEQDLRANVVQIAVNWLGCKKSDGSHKKIIDLYNRHTPLASGYRVQYTDPWCATFVSAVAIKAGLTDIMPTECSCSRMIALYQKLGRWQENDAYVPKPGDIMMYDWHDSGKGDCTGAPEHVGIVTRVSGSTIQVIEGNKNNAVGYRKMRVNGRYIRGYCLPDYAAKANGRTTVQVEPAKYFDKQLSGTYYTTAVVNLRAGDGTAQPVLTVLLKGAMVRNYGYYNTTGTTKWLYVQYVEGGKTALGYISSVYLKRL